MLRERRPKIEEKMVSTEPNLRIPAILMPAYHKLLKTEEGKTAEKRVKVYCGICKETRYYSIHRGVTRIGGVVLACEACRHYYQKFKRKPCILRCRDKDSGSCHVLGDNSKNRCKACWIAHLLRICPFPEDLYLHLQGHLPNKLKASMSSKPVAPEDVSEDDRGELGLEVLQDKEWVDVNTVIPPEPDPVPEPEPKIEPELHDEEDTKMSEQDYETGKESESLPDGFEQNSDTLDNYASDCHEMQGTPCPNDSEVSSVEQVREIERDGLRWWMEQEEGTPYTLPESGSSESYYSVDGTSSSDGLTSLTPLQPAGCLTTLTPLQVPQDQHNQNGFHNSSTMLDNIKQEKYDWQDGESQEAQLFQKISIKREYYLQPEQMDDITLHTSPYFTSVTMGDQLGINILNQNYDTANGSTSWNIENPCIDNVSRTSLQENTEPVKPTKRIRKPKVKLEEGEIISTKNTLEKIKRSAPDNDTDGAPLPSPSKQKKKPDRFNGMDEKDVAMKTLPDHLGPNLDILIIGINPGLTAAHKGHHYAGPGNHFWKCMYLSGLIPKPFTAFDDFRLLEYGIGFTNMVSRTTRGSSDLTKKEIKEGGELLRLKLKRYKPRIAVFNGKGIYEIFSGKKEFCFGRQPEMVEGTKTHIWVMPSSSARCAQLPRALDKVPFYSALRKFRDYLKGTISELDEEEVVFSNVKLTNFKPPIKLEPEAEAAPESKCVSAKVAKHKHKKVGSDRTKGQKSPQKKKTSTSKT
ncbi:uncharacterized protein LOC123499975 isoform X2 [Portunus trituberculatus]|uniref:uncharacterized protein LOC123499975 isoform X2 n=1 Tax=Portunus trituberculatus TaxID=210409 RepID=UPI001E1CB866|nr:uncharacterized protein LOC123499975 isoform X2 [Portunus trituberculatus]